MQGPGPYLNLLAYILQILTIPGQSTGLFVYDGAPENGNPPIFAIVAPGTTTDPYNNPVQAVMNAGNLSGAHFGLDDQGNAYLADSTGDTRIYLSPINDLLAFYSAGTASLQTTVAAQAGTDPLTGKPFIAGFEQFGTNGSYIKITDSGGVASAILSGGAADEQTPGRLSIGVNGATPYDEEFGLVGPQLASPNNDYCWVGLQSAESDGSGRAGGNLYYVDTSGTERVLLEWGASGIFAVNYKDGQEYDIQRRTLFAAGQNIASTSYAPVSGLSGYTVAAQTYRVHGKIMLQCVSAATGVISFTGPALSSLDMEWIMTAILNSPSSNADSFTWRTVNSLNGITTVAMATTGLWTLFLDGQITFSAGGSFGLEAALASGNPVGANYNIIGNSYLDLMPVTV